MFSPSPTFQQTATGTGTKKSSLLQLLPHFSTHLWRWLAVQECTYSIFLVHFLTFLRSNSHVPQLGGSGFFLAWSSSDVFRSRKDNRKVETISHQSIPLLRISSSWWSAQRCSCVCVHARTPKVLRKRWMSSREVIVARVRNCEAVVVGGVRRERDLPPRKRRLLKRWKIQLLLED